MRTYERGRNTQLGANIVRTREQEILKCGNDDQSSPHWLRLEWWTEFAADARWNPRISVLHGSGNAVIPFVADIDAGSVCMLADSGEALLCNALVGDSDAFGSSPSTVNVICRRVATFVAARATYTKRFDLGGGTASAVVPRPNGADTVEISTVNYGVGRNVRLQEFADVAGGALIANTVVVPSQIVQLTGQTRSVRIFNDSGGGDTASLTFTLGNL